MASKKALTDREWLRLLHALAGTPDGATQRVVAKKLGLTKVQARQWLRAAVAAGLVTEAVEGSVAEPGRRMFSLRRPDGVEALRRLRTPAPVIARARRGTPGESPTDRST